MLAALDVTHDYAREIQDKVNEQQAVFDSAERAELLKDLQRMFFERNCCTLPIPTRSIDYYAINSRVQNMPPPPDAGQTAAFGLYRTQNIWLEDA